MLEEVQKNVRMIDCYWLGAGKSGKTLDLGFGLGIMGLVGF